MKLQKPGAKTDTNYFCFLRRSQTRRLGEGGGKNAPPGFLDDNLKARLEQESWMCRIRPAGLRELRLAGWVGHWFNSEKIKHFSK